MGPQSPWFVRTARERLAAGDLGGALAALSAGLDDARDDPTTLGRGLAMLARVQLAAGRLPEAFTTAVQAAEAAPADPVTRDEAHEVRDGCLARAFDAAAAGPERVARAAMTDFIGFSVLADVMAHRGPGDPVTHLHADGFRVPADEAEELRTLHAQVADAADARARSDFAWALTALGMANHGSAAGALFGRLAAVRERFALRDDEARLFVLAASCAVHPGSARMARLCARDGVAPAASLFDLLRMTQRGDPTTAFAQVLQPGGVLRANGLLEPSPVASSPLAAPPVVPLDVVEFLLSGDDRAAARTLGMVLATPLSVAHVCVEASVRKAVEAAWDGALAGDGRGGVLVLSGERGTGRRTLAAALAGGHSLGLLVVGLEPFTRALAEMGPARLVAGLARSCRMAHLVPYLDLTRPPAEADRTAPALPALPAFPLGALAAMLATPVFAGVSPAALPGDLPDGASIFDIPKPSREALGELVAALTADLGDLLPPASRDAIAGSVSTPGQAAELCTRLRQAAAQSDGSAARITAAAKAAVQRRSVTEFGAFAVRLVPGFRLTDLVAPQDLKDRLAELAAFHRHRAMVFDSWGFGRKLPYGRALSALFSGPPGTGKTMAATIVAAELALDVFRVDLSQIVSKYVGETEKALGRVFEAATRSHAMLLFDEAEALFGRRGEVRSGTDRYANLEVNFLLQMMEDFDGVTVLTTNNPQSIDEAFKRRLRFRIAFPFPDESLRATLWQSMLPEGAPRARDLDFEALAREFEFSGGHIKNAVLRAAFSAAQQGGPITHEQLLGAARLEYEELGRVVRKT